MHKKSKNVFTLSNNKSYFIHKTAMQHSSNKSVRIIIVLIILLLRKESYGFILQPFETLRLSSQPSLYLSASSACCILENEFGTSETITSTLTSHLNLATFSKEELLSQNDCVYTHFLTWVPYQYDQLQDYALAIATLDRSGKNNKPKMNMNPFFVDFFPPAKSRLGKRASGESGRDLLIKAVGLPNRCMSDVTIYDLTAGFGQDSLLMAKSGAGKVYMVERNPVLTCLLKDALRRLVVLTEANCIRDPIRREASDLADRLHLIHDDGLNVANALLTADIESRPEIIYLDPMFPER
jgi:hypothetical protein